MRFWNTEESNEYIDFHLVGNHILGTSTGKIVGERYITIENTTYEVVQGKGELLVFSLDENGEQEGYFPFIFRPKEVEWYDNIRAFLLRWRKNARLLLNDKRRFFEELQLFDRKRTRNASQ